MYPKFDILGCKGMTKTFHFIGEQTNMVHTLKTRFWHVPLTNSRNLERQLAGCRDLSWDAGSLVANPSSGATCQGGDNRGGR